ncbi:hypothetical protein KFK09_014535 [Dendrobium nobile]|uniref:Uncharacterized protein n=1 Tax=Dendrobium nobile TaxID=94219 RepID=A0A8T3B3F6_DENNO|nr:hypothetical protein KFK09_014535 [Dendrobium nobile]
MFLRQIRLRQKNRVGEQCDPNIDMTLFMGIGQSNSEKNADRMEQRENATQMYGVRLEMPLITRNDILYKTINIIGSNHQILSPLLNKSYYAWMTFSELHGSVTNKQVNLQVLRLNLKLASILMGQIVHLENWSTLDEGHEISFKGAIDALKASTLRLPVIGGAKVDIKEVKDALNSALGVLQSMMVSVSSLLSKVEGISSLVSEFGKLAANEEAFLNHCRDLISIVEALHVDLGICFANLQSENHGNITKFCKFPAFSENPAEFRRLQAVGRAPAVVEEERNRLFPFSFFFSLFTFSPFGVE